MTSPDLLPPSCDFNEKDEPANTICIAHQKLMCHFCSLKNAKTSQSCCLLPINTLSHEKDKALLEFLRLKQSVSKRMLELKEYENVATTVKDYLKERIMETHKNLNNRLEELKQESIKSLVSKTSEIEHGIKEKKQSLVKLESALNSILEKVSTDENENTTEYKSKAVEMRSSIMGAISEEVSTPEGEFKPNKDLETTILNCRNGLGHVEICKVKEGDYEISGPLNESTQSKDQSTKGQTINIRDSTYHDKKPSVPAKRSKQHSVSLPDDSHKNQILSIPPSDYKLETKSPQVPQELQSVSADAKKAPFTQTKLHEPKQEKRRSWFNLFPKKDKYTPSAAQKSTEVERGTEAVSEIYEKLGQIKTKDVSLFQLINDTVTLKGLKKKDTKPFKNSAEIVSLGQSHLALLSSANRTVGVVAIDGSMKCQKNMSNAKASIVATGDQQLAVLLKEESKIEIFDFSGTDLLQKCCFTLKGMTDNITGFDYDAKGSQFAISSPGSISIIEKGGNILRTQWMEISKAFKIKTTYNFGKDCLYVLNFDHQTLKCLCLSKLEKHTDWAYKLEKPPKDMCLNNDLLFVACSDDIIVVQVVDGTPVHNIHTKKILEDCLAITCIGDVIVFSSGSDDVTKSLSLGFAASR